MDSVASKHPTFWKGNYAGTVLCAVETGHQGEGSSLFRRVNSKEAFPEIYCHLVGNYLFEFLKIRLLFLLPFLRYQFLLCSSHTIEPHKFFF